MSPIIRTASARRTDMRAEADAAGVNEAFIDALVETFYARVREDDLLGPVFAHAIGADWAGHLATMKQFWQSVALGSGAYSGRPIPAHHKHVDRMGPEHFTRWLSLFERTLEDISENDDARAFFMVRAERIGARFQDILFSDRHN
ncbi:MAG: group III truncated hemoglobin [Oceanicaulis sp.]